MKKCIVIAILSLLILIQISWQKAARGVSDELRAWLLTELKQTQHELNALQIATDKNTRRIHYHAARKHYKHIEFFVEYTSPRESKYYINGPLVPKFDADMGAEVYAPQGFQRIEELFFGGEPLDKVALEKECKLLNAQFDGLLAYYASIQIEEGQLLEMCQLELFRIAAMNLSGYDATIIRTNVTEAFWSMEGIEKVIQCFSPGKKKPALQQSYSAVMTGIFNAKQYLQAHPNYNAFNRLQFITKHVNGLNKALVAFHKQSGLPWDERKSALNLKEGFLFGKESFNLRFFSMYYNDTLNLDLQAALGKKLFFDPILSGNNARSCASCHDPAKAFTDGLPKSAAFEDGAILQRNAPTLLNVIYQKAFFHDGRVYQLEQQIFDVVHNKEEMNSTLEEDVTKLRENEAYRSLFTKAFHGTTDSVITAYAIQKALTEYEKTLVSFNSRFDKYIRGNAKALSAREVNGYNLFAGKALCGSCHFFPLFNGTVPPFFNDNEYEVIGVAKGPDNKELDEDLGRYKATNQCIHKNAFKTPTLRNIALTAPYMHNGAYNMLEEIVEFYHRGGGAGFGLQVPNQTLPFDSLQLSLREKQDIVLFMKTLTEN